MVKNVRTNVKKMVNHTIGVGKSLDPGITVHLLYLVRSERILHIWVFDHKKKKLIHFRYQLNKSTMSNVCYFSI